MLMDVIHQNTQSAHTGQPRLFLYCKKCEGLVSEEGGEAVL